MIDDEHFEQVLVAVKRTAGGLAGLEAAIRAAAAAGRPSVMYARAMFYVEAHAHVIVARLDPRGHVFAKWAL